MTKYDNVVKPNYHPFFSFYLKFHVSNSAVPTSPIPIPISPTIPIPIPTFLFPFPFFLFPFTHYQLP